MIWQLMSVDESTPSPDGGPVELERFPPEDIEQARRRTIYLAASLRRKGFLRGSTIEVHPGDPPSLVYLSRYVELVHLFAHGERLFQEVLPDIRSRLAASVVRRQENRPWGVRGAPDIPATMRRAFQHDAAQASVLPVRRSERDYGNLGNRLTVLTLHTVSEHVRKLLRERSIALTRFEQQQLEGLMGKAEAELNRDPFRGIAAKLGELLRRYPDSTAERRLEDEVDRKAGTPEAPANYGPIVAWRRDWRRWLTGVDGALVRAPIWKCKDFDLYELIVLLELGTAFARRGRNAAQRRGRGESESIPTFEFELDDGRSVNLWFQSETALKSATEVASKPDIIIGTDGGAVVLEVKSFRNSKDLPDGRHREALYRVMAYMFSYGYHQRWDSLSGGAVVFPESAGERHPPGYRRLKICPSEPLWIGSLIIPFTGAEGASRAHVDGFVDDIIGGTR